MRYVEILCLNLRHNVRLAGPGVRQLDFSSPSVASGRSLQGDRLMALFPERASPRGCLICTGVPILCGS
jgi:hypothetical protein